MPSLGNAEKSEESYRSSILNIELSSVQDNASHTLFTCEDKPFYVMLRTN